MAGKPHNPHIAQAVATMTANGKSAAEIAKALMIGTATVSRYRAKQAKARKEAGL